jgi:hypothetical protein
MHADAQFVQVNMPLLVDHEKRVVVTLFTDRGEYYYCTRYFKVPMVEREEFSLLFISFF